MSHAGAVLGVSCFFHDAAACVLTPDATGSPVVRVALAELSGQREEVLEIIIDPSRLQSYGVTGSDLFRVVAANNQLIPAGSVDTGKGRFVVARLSLNALIQDTTQLLQLSISKHAVLRQNLAQELPPIEADATQIRQVIMNLITNASEAIDAYDAEYADHQRYRMFGSARLMKGVLRRLGADVVEGRGFHGLHFRGAGQESR